jgi:hypothetical protein
MPQITQILEVSPPRVKDPPGCVRSSTPRERATSYQGSLTGLLGLTLAASGRWAHPVLYVFLIFLIFLIFL